MSPEPIATGYMAPLHGRGAAGFILAGLMGVIVAATGLVAPNVALVAGGIAVVLFAAAGLAAYFRFVAKWPLVRVYEDRVEVVRGPQRGVLLFDDVDGARGLQWGRSLYPYNRASTVLVLTSRGTDWQFGKDIADHETVQAAVVAALNAHRGLVQVESPGPQAPV